MSGRGGFQRAHILSPLKQGTKNAQSLTLNFNGLVLFIFFNPILTVCVLCMGDDGPIGGAKVIPSEIKCQKPHEIKVSWFLSLVLQIML